MKKSIFIIALALISFASFGQSKSNIKPLMADTTLKDNLHIETKEEAMTANSYWGITQKTKINSYENTKGTQFLFIQSGFNYLLKISPPDSSNVVTVTIYKSALQMANGSTYIYKIQK